MKLMIIISDLIIPLMFALIILFGISKKMKIYDTFIEGAKDGVAVVFKIFPTLLGLMVAVGVLSASGTLDLLAELVSPLTNAIGFPKEALALTLMRLVSSSASNGLLLDIFKSHGPDSFLGRFVSVMMSCTETVFYTMSIYFMSVKITKTRYTLPGALAANLAGVIASIYITTAVFGK